MPSFFVIWCNKFIMSELAFIQHNYFFKIPIFRYCYVGLIHYFYNGFS